MKFLFTEKSRNQKTGPIPVVTASRTSCPTSCGLYDSVCYALLGPLKLVWDRVDKDGISFENLLTKIKSLSPTQLWRYGQAGDLPGEGNTVDECKLDQLATANAGRPAIVYTHKRNFEAIRRACDKRLHINLSADSLDEADELMETGLSVVVVLDHAQGRKTKGKEWGESLAQYRDRMGGRLTLTTPAGHKVVMCPATYTDTNCKACGLCAKPRTHGEIIGFPAHGPRAKKYVNRSAYDALHTTRDHRRSEPGAGSGVAGCL